MKNRNDTYENVSFPQQGLENCQNINYNIANAFLERICRNA